MFLSGFGDNSLSVSANIYEQNKGISAVMKTIISTINYNWAKIFLQNFLFFVIWFSALKSCYYEKVNLLYGKTTYFLVTAHQYFSLQEV